MDIRQGKLTRVHPRSSAGDKSPLSYWLSRHWVAVFALALGFYVGLPLLAPVFMQLGWSRAADAIYFIYSFQCHQLPQRSFFLFGPQAMYSLSEIQAAWQNTSDPLLLRQFIGNPEMGWKVAWSDRMVSMYASALIFGLAWTGLRRLKLHYPGLPIPLRLPWWGLTLFLLPMALDGITHLLSDLSGLDQGFRYTNAWLAALSNNVFPPSFYVGNALGSFNSWMRLISGVSFGLGVTWFGFPYVAELFGVKEQASPEMKSGFHPI